MFGITARVRARKAYKKHGYNQELNPYKPRFGCFVWGFTDNWTHWYEAHREEHYKEVIPNYNPKDWYSTFPDDF